MKKCILLSWVLVLLLTGCKGKEPVIEPKPDPETNYSVNLKRDVLVLMMAYPTFVKGVELSAGNPYLVMASGLKILYDDQKVKTYDEKFAQADIQDMLEQLYPLTDTTGIAALNIDPGRFRVYAFFNDVFGATKEKTSANLVKVTFGTQNLSFTQLNGAHLAFKKATDLASALAIKEPSIKAYMYPSSGTYNYRVISETNVLSMHAYGIALDMRFNDQDYWQWANLTKAEARIVQYPKSLVKIYEDQGFIWGGKWNHFDTVHYEYRPEIILKARYFSAPIDITKPWATGINLTDSTIKVLIDQINTSLKGFTQ